jgi:hypothetical protein
MTLTGLPAAMFALGLSLTGAAFFLFMPRMIFSRLAANNLLRIRDEFVDEVLAGTVSRSDPAVLHLMHRMQSSVDEHADLSMASLFSFTRRIRQRPDLRDSLNHAPARAPEALDETTAKVVEEYDTRMSEAAIIHAAVGTWFGIGVTVVACLYILVRQSSPAPKAAVKRAKRYGQKSASAYLLTQDHDMQEVAVAN